MNMTLLQKTNYVIRNMTRDDLETAIDWAADEGWNPGIKDADCFYNSDPQGFFIGELNGKPIGCISAVTYGDSFGFIGFYIVKPEYRGQGYGIQLWKAAMDRMGNRVIGLDGVLAEQENYKKSGFETVYHNFRFEGISVDYGSKSREIIDLSTVSSAGLLSYDGLLFPSARPEFINRWIKPDDGAALGYITGNQLKGYSVIRACRNGYRIGPLFADSDSIAEALLMALMSRIRAGAPVFLDVPEINVSALELAKRFEMQTIFETARMYRGETPQIDLGKVYGVTSFELG